MTLLSEKLVTPCISGVALLIPAYNPTTTLVNIVCGAHDAFGLGVVVVNDGSDTPSIFNELESIRLPRLKIIHHQTNLGKGAALKTGFRSLQAFSAEEIKGIVTADADGQHSIEDILEIGRKGANNPESFVIGARSLDSNVPIRSLVGNAITKYIFWMYTGKKINDTQSGLRFLPASFLVHCQAIEQERYDFELTVLIEATRQDLNILESPIETIYEKGNIGSHFRPFLDSTRIYLVFLRFSAVALSSAAIDITLFCVVLFVSSNVLGALIVSRILSGLFNFLANRHFSFSTPVVLKGMGQDACRYLSLAVFSVVASFTVISVSKVVAYEQVVKIKILTDVALFFFNYFALKIFVFRRKK